MIPCGLNELCGNKMTKVKLQQKTQSSTLSPESSNLGFSLIELVITIVILGFTSMIIIPFFQATISSPDPMLRQKAISLGQAMMDEILSKRWDENTPVGGGPICTTESPNQAIRASLIDNCVTTSTAVGGLGTDGGESAANDRRNWDDADDYDGLAEASGALKDQDNKDLGITGYSRDVSVGYMASNTDPINYTTGFSGSTTDTKLIKVTVTSPRGEKFKFVATSCSY